MSQINTVGADLAESAAGARRHRYHRLRVDRASDLDCAARAVSARKSIPLLCRSISDEIHELDRAAAAFRKEAATILMRPTVLVDWARTDETRQILLTDAQTSGGLLLCVAEANLREALKVLRKAGTPSAARDRTNRTATTSPPIDMHDRMKCDTRRQIPAVSKVLDALGHSDLPRPFVVEIIRRKIVRDSRKQRRFPNSNPLSLSSVARSMNFAPADFNRSSTEPELSFTQISDAPRFRSEAIRALNEIGSGYSNLEYDLVTGERGRRGGYVETALALLCEAEAATVVNNCAAALVLIVQHFTKLASANAKRDEVVISRGELVQIGGGFRISEILEASGAKLREVGATNKTTLEDYAHAIGSEDRDDPESASQQFFHERLCRIAFLERDQRAREEEADSICRRSRKRRDRRD